MKARRRILHAAVLCTLTLVAVALTGCHSKRHVVKGSSGTIVTLPSKPKGGGSSADEAKSSAKQQNGRYDEMRRSLESRQYDSPDITRLVREAAKWIGTPYRHGGNDRQGVDCSGFVRELFRTVFGQLLPRSTLEQQADCAPVAKTESVPGDLIFFATGKDPRRVSHVGLYIGDGQMVHASSSSGVIIAAVDGPYFGPRYLSTGRADGVANAYISLSDSKKHRKDAVSDTKQASPKVGKQKNTIAAPEPVMPPSGIIIPDSLLQNLPDFTPIDLEIDQAVDSIFNQLFD